MFNTGTMVGVACNIFGEGFPPKFIPSFSWGGASGLVPHRIEEAMETATRVMARRDITFGETDEKIFRNVFNLSAVYR